ncbi:hypothetical protein EW145_g5165 [Phellinidium pouzarii]|uniref:Uncharacterized protein n=1 Tax=Phellinidium pouzarii TaxID=167371 RepID=A0A4V3XC93_9AGAM|nr:hypothetical protein EW145_g5165 [Phellinidium pouzarii]
MPSQRPSSCITHSYSPYPHHHSANINHLHNILNNPTLCPAIDNIINQPEHHAIQIPLYIHDVLQLDIDSILQQRQILKNIIDTHTTSLHTFQSMMTQNHHSEHLHHEQSQFFLNAALCHGAAKTLSQFFEDIDTDISSNSSPPPLAIPNTETCPSGSPENPITVDNDIEEQFYEVSEAAIQTLPTSPSPSDSSNHRCHSIDLDMLELPLGQHTIWVTPRAEICIICGDVGHNQFTCPYPSD